MMKKFAAVAGAGALLLSVAVPALGFFPIFPPMPSNDINIGNWAMVDTDVYTKATTGNNDLGGMCVFGGEIRTGAAEAVSSVKLDVNSSIIACPSCYGDTSIHNVAFVDTDVFTKANTGYNDMGAKFLGGGLIKTGDSGAASVVDAVVNFSMVGYPLD